MSKPRFGKTRERIAGVPTVSPLPPNSGGRKEKAKALSPIEQLELEKNNIQANLKPQQERLEQIRVEVEKIKKKEFQDRTESFMGIFDEHQNLVDVLAPEHYQASDRCNDDEHGNADCTRCLLLEMLMVGHWNSEYEIRFELERSDRFAY